MKERTSTWVRLVLCVVAVVLTGLLLSGIRTAGTIEVVLHNRTGSTLTGVMFAGPDGAGKPGTPASLVGARSDSTARVPLASSVVVTFSGSDGKTRRVRYPYPSTRWPIKRLDVRLTKDRRKDLPTGKYLSSTNSFDVIGSRTHYFDSIQAIDERETDTNRKKGMEGILDPKAGR
jgi:hypothetical protein